MCSMLAHDGLSDGDLLSVDVVEFESTGIEENLGSGSSSSVYAVLYLRLLNYSALPDIALSDIGKAVLVPDKELLPGMCNLVRLN